MKLICFSKNKIARIKGLSLEIRKLNWKLGKPSLTYYYVGADYFKIMGLEIWFRGAGSEHFYCYLPPMFEEKLYSAMFDKWLSLLNEEKCRKGR